MPQRSSLRASDADRDHVAARLHRASTEGRLLPHELEERLARAFRAQTYGDLAAIVEDLPRETAGPMERGRPMGLTLLRRYPLAMAVLGCVIGTVFAAVLAAVVTVAATGLWIIPLIFWFIFRGERGRARRNRANTGLGHLHMHARRYGRF